MYMIFTHNIATGDIIKLKALSFSCHCWFIIVNMLPACLHVSLSISLTIYPSLCLVLGKISIQAQMKDTGREVYLSTTVQLIACEEKVHMHLLHGFVVYQDHGSDHGLSHMYLGTLLETKTCFYVINLMYCDNSYFRIIHVNKVFMLGIMLEKAC